MSNGIEINSGALFILAYAGLIAVILILANLLGGRRKWNK